ncbi:MAG: hypothetical protein ACK5NT_11425 [Pyrinomonadaceae bacterium]
MNRTFSISALFLFTFFFLGFAHQNANAQVVSGIVTASKATASGVKKASLVTAYGAAKGAKATAYGTKKGSLATAKGVKKGSIVVARTSKYIVVKTCDGTKWVYRKIVPKKRKRVRL